MTTAGALPLYLQVSEMLIRDIAAGRLADGAKLPTEREMAANLGLAVGTLRKALADLENKGLLERVQGSGNYIRAAESPQSIYAFFRLERIAGGGLPSARTLSVRRLKKPAYLPSFGTHSEAHRIRRLRLISGVVSALEEIWLDASVADALNADEMSESLYLHYRQHLKLHIARAEDHIGLGHVPAWAPSDCPLRPGATTPLITRLAWDGQNRQVEVSLTWFDSNTTRYVSRLK